MSAGRRSRIVRPASSGTSASTSRRHRRRRRRRDEAAVWRGAVSALPSRRTRPEIAMRHALARPTRLLATRLLAARFLAARLLAIAALAGFGAVAEPSAAV